MANGGTLGGLGSVPGLGGYLGGRQVTRNRESHRMNMQNQRQIMRQRQQQMEALQREAEQWENEETLRTLKRTLEESETRSAIEDQPAQDRLQDLERDVETRETEYLLENWEDLKQREREQSLLEMEETRAGIEETRASAYKDRADARQNITTARQDAVNLVAGSIPQDPSSMTQRDLNRLRRRASESGFDPDDMGIPRNVNNPQSQEQLRNLQRRSQDARDQRNELEQIRERERAKLWRSQQEYEQGIGEEHTPTQLARHISERDQMSQRLAMARDQGNEELASKLERDLSLYNERIKNHVSEAESRGKIVARLWSKVIEGRSLTPEEASILRYEAVSGNPIAGRIQESMGMELDQYVEEKDAESPGNQTTDQTRVDDTPEPSPEFTDDTMVETPNGEARFGDLVESQMQRSEMNQSQARDYVQSLIQGE